MSNAQTMDQSQSGQSRAYRRICSHALKGAKSGRCGGCAERNGGARSMNGLTPRSRQRCQLWAITGRGGVPINSPEPTNTSQALAISFKAFGGSGGIAGSPALVR